QLENLRNLLNNQGQDHAKDCLWLYYDIKTRISMKRLSSHANDTESKEWIKKKYCIDEVSEIEKIALPVWSDNLLSNVLSDNKKKKELNKFIDQPYFEYHFNEWFLKFIYFFVAGEIGRT
ncbi:hypothetical protein, partial [Elstera litoralis]|uniref:hypothetical protein n=1 Tax=Elstera litoralis TaxID=552518 RepID=UPI001E401AFD